MLALLDRYVSRPIHRYLIAAEASKSPCIKHLSGSNQWMHPMILKLHHLHATILEVICNLIFHRDYTHVLMVSNNIHIP